MTDTLPFLTWSDLLSEHILQYEACQSRQEKLRLIHHWLKLNADAKRTPLVAELFFNAMQWSSSEKYTAAQTSTFFSILRIVHELCIATHEDNLTDVVTKFRDLVALHSVQRPPFTIGLFTHEQAGKLNTYMQDTYFRHYKLYKHAFSPRYTLDLHLHYNHDPEPEEEPEEEEDDDELPSSAMDGVDGETGRSRVPSAELSVKQAAERELRRHITSMAREELKKAFSQAEVDVNQQMKELEKSLTAQLRAIANAEKKKKKK